MRVDDAMVWKPQLKVEKLKIYRNEFDTDISGLQLVFDPTPGNWGGARAENGEFVDSYNVTGGSSREWVAGSGLEVGRVIIEAKVNQLGTWVGIGIEWYDGSKRIFYILDALAGRKRIEYRDSGGATEITGIDETVSTPVYIRVVITGKYFIAFESSDGVNWTKKLEVDISSYFDMFDESTLQSLRVAFGYGANDVDQEIHIDYFEAYYFTGFGARDPSLMKTVNGRIATYNGKYYLVVTGSGHGVQGAAGLLVVATDIEDLSTYNVIGQFVTRLSIGGAVKRCAAHPVRIVVEPDKNRALIFISFNVVWDIDDTQNSRLVVIDIDTLKSWLDNGGLIIIDLVNPTYQNVVALNNHTQMWDFDCAKDGDYYYIVATDTIGQGNLRLYRTTDPTQVPWEEVGADLTPSGQAGAEGGTIVYVIGEGLRVYYTRLRDFAWIKKDLSFNDLGSETIPSPLDSYRSWHACLPNAKVLGFTDTTFYDIYYSHGELEIVTDNTTFYKGTEEQSIEIAVFQITSYPSSVSASPGATITINVTVANNGSVDGTVEVRIRDHNDNVVASKQVSIAAGSSVTVELSATAPSQEGSYTWSIEAYNVDAGTVDDSKQFTLNVTAWATLFNQIMNILPYILMLLIFVLVISMVISAFRS